MNVQGFKFDYKRDENTVVEKLVKQAVLPLHHHMAPSDDEGGDTAN